MKKALNLKNMKETIVNYSADQKEFANFGMHDGLHRLHRSRHLENVL